MSRPLDIRACVKPDSPGFYLFVGRARPEYTKVRVTLVRVGSHKNGLICMDDTDVMTPDEWGSGSWYMVVGLDAALLAVASEAT